MKKLSELLLKAVGWKVNDFIPPEDKYVLIVAPHTSAADFIYGRLAFWSKRIPGRILIKKEFFFFPIGGLLKAVGGLPIDRKQARNVVEHATRLLATHRQLALILTPEGTRKRTEHWKKGFYFIAKRAGVPLYAGIVDYRTKTCSILPQPLNTDQPFDNLMEDIRKIYTGTRGRHPENFNF